MACPGMEIERVSRGDKTLAVCILGGLYFPMIQGLKQAMK